MTSDPTALGTVYFVERDGLIKIGWTCNIRRRIRELNRGAQSIPGQTVGPVTRLASYRGTLLDEAALHRRFAELRVGGEWFRHESALRRHIEDLVELEAIYWAAVFAPHTVPAPPTAVFA